MNFFTMLNPATGTIRSLASMLCLVTFGSLVMSATASEDHHLKSPYAGQEKRTIKSLSEDDIKQLSEGKGWGLAKAAELNGMPGPAHILEMKKEINLTEAQQEKIQKLFNSMQQKAKTLGENLIQLEAELNQSFADKTVTPDSLRRKLADIEKIRSELRFVHLATHLETPAILNETQIAQYNKLRGYGNDDPCNNVPRGHDRTMWLQHNGCL